jgi:SAM-dependent methyltransferase
MKTHPESCPACDAPGPFSDYCAASFLPGDERNIVACSHCGLSILWPLPTGTELTTYYHQGYYDFNRSREEGKGLYFARQLKKLAPTGRFLDVGCATGFFLSGIQKNCEWELYGLETGRDAAAYARQNLGIEIQDQPIENAVYPKDFFDYIHLNNVLEHTTAPLAVLSATNRILKPGGKLFMAVPNGPVDRWGYLEFLKKTGQNGASKDGHLFFFTKDSLQALCERSGLRIQKAQSSGLKRAFRVLGYWPQKKGWESAYQGRPNAQRSVDESVIEGKKHSACYYIFKHSQENLFQMPGFHPWTYDFNLMLTK